MLLLDSRKSIRPVRTCSSNPKGCFGEIWPELKQLQKSRLVKQKMKVTALMKVKAESNKDINKHDASFLRKLFFVE